MTFKIGNNAVSKRVTLEQLTAGLDQVKDKKKIDRITLIFNKYNTNIQKGSAEALDIDEQVALMNDLHKADGNAGDFDGKVSRRGLKKAGFTGEYKAYRDFMEAYQKAVGETQNTYDLNFKDDTIDGKQIIETTAKRSDTVGGQDFTEQHQYINNQKARLTYQTADGTFSYDPQGHLTRQTTADNQTIMYQAYTSDAKNASAGRIVVRDADNNRTTFELQEDGTYMNKDDNSLYKLNDKAIPEKYTPPEPPKEPPAPEPVEPTIQKQARPTQRHLIKMTDGWKNQRVKPDEEMTAKFNSMSTAGEILAELVKDKDGINQETLRADLIKNNPSVFNSDGIIYSDARWERLDFPSNLSRYKTN